MRIKTTLVDTVPSLLNGITSQLPSRAAMGEIAGKAKSLIETRTLEGREADGSDFEPYKTAPYYAPLENRPPGYPAPSGGRITKSGKSMYFPSYEDYKVDIGFGPEPQLSISNQMLSDIDWVVQNKTRSVLFFASRLSAAKAHFHHTGDRPFFELGDINSEQEINEFLLEKFRQVRRKAESGLKRRVSKSQ